MKKETSLFLVVILCIFLTSPTQGYAFHYASEISFGHSNEYVNSICNVDFQKAVAQKALIQSYRVSKDISGQLVGKWANATMETTKRKFISESGFDAFRNDEIKELHLMPNQKLNVVLSNNARERSAEGKWRISPDGQELILEGVEGYGIPTTFKIKYLELDEMVLAPSTPSDDDSTRRNYFFNKF